MKQNKKKKTGFERIERLVCRSSPRPLAGNAGGGLATEAFAGPAGLTIICENYIG